MSPQTISHILLAFLLTYFDRVSFSYLALPYLHRFIFPLHIFLPSILHPSTNHLPSFHRSFHTSLVYHQLRIPHPLLYHPPWHHPLTHKCHPFHPFHFSPLLSAHYFSFSPCHSRRCPPLTHKCHPFHPSPFHPYIPPPPFHTPV